MSLILRPDQVKACTTIIDAAGVGRIFGLGHIPAPGHRFTNARFALARAGIATPPAEGLSYLDILPRNVDQGPTGSCEAHAASKTLAAVFTKAGIPLGFIPSMNDLYKCRVFDRANDAQPLQDVGTMGNSVIRWFQEYGVRPMGPRPADGRFSDCDPTTLQQEPDLAALEQDSNCKLVGAYSIYETSQSDLVGAYMQNLCAFGPIPTASFVDSAVMQWQMGMPPIDSVDQDDPQGGGHKYVIAGWSGYLNGKLVPANTPGATRVWLLDNSWGAGWGNAGVGLVTDNFLSLTTEREVYNCRKAA